MDGFCKVNLSDHWENKSLILIRIAYILKELRNMTVLKYNYICAIALLF